MKERVLDVLMYLFDHCVDSTQESPSDQSALVEELESAGFGSGEIDKAFDWLEGIHEIQLPDEKSSAKQAFRVLSTEERQKLNLECQGLLVSLTDMGILDRVTREVILDRCTALNLPQISIEHFKWIVLMVLINRGNEHSLEWLEEIIFDDGEAQIH